MFISIFLQALFCQGLNINSTIAVVISFICSENYPAVVAVIHHS